jgi:hypothetical protein
MTRPVLALFSLLVAAGCGPSHYLIWEAAPPAPGVMGRAAISVADRREAKKGGQDPSVVGFQRNGWGIPFAIHIGGPEQLSMDMHDLIAQAALSAGIGVAAPGQDQGATSRIVIEIQNFWCDGYWPVYKGGVVASVVITDAATNQVRIPGQPLQAEGSDGQCRGAYHKALNSLFMTARAMFSSPQIRGALLAAGGPPPGAPPPPAQ